MRVVESVAAPEAALDESGFVALVGPLMEPALRLAYSMLGDRAEAEDATQEAVTKAWRKLHQLRPGMPVRPWFLAIVANQCRNVRRARWFRLPRLATVDRSAEWRDPAGKLDLERALERLPMADRQALFLHYYLDLPIEEVAQALGTTAGAVKVRIHRARARLRPGLEEVDV